MSDGCPQKVGQLRFNHYENQRKEKVAFVTEALKQGRLQEFSQAKTPKHFDPSNLSP